MAIDPPPDNPFASPRELVDDEADRYSPGEDPPTIIFAVLVCFLAGTLMMISGTIFLSAVGFVATILAPILFFPLRIIWYAAVIYFVFATIACALVVVGGFVGRTHPMGIWMALPAMTLGVVLQILLSLPGSRQYYGLHN